MSRSMTKYLFIASAAALATQAQAQDAPPPVQAPAQAAPQPNLRGNWLQADMTRQQAQQRADTMFQRLDANHDGVLTRQEAQQAASQMGGGQGGGGRFAVRMVDRLFAAGDSVTLAQFDAQALARFDRMDLNHDGVVTADERQQSRGQRRQERGD
jgi:Ca2+-binding EF-hand superfamily protein